MHAGVPRVRGSDPVRWKYKVGDFVIGRDAQGESFQGTVTEALAHSVVLDGTHSTPHSLIRHVTWPIGQVVPEAPSQIKDRNGVVVLQLCRRCGQAESQLDMECKP